MVLVHIFSFCSVERRGPLTHNHIQMVGKSNLSGLPILHKKMKVALGWDQAPLTGHIVFCKKFRDEGCIFGVEIT